MAYAAWTAELTYAGAFYIQTYDLEESTVGFLLAIAAARVHRRDPRHRAPDRAGPAPLADRLERLRHGRDALPVPERDARRPAFSVAVIVVLAVFAGLRSTGASSLGLDQLPDQPGSMMAARTASAQLGYMIGAVAGGAVLAVADFGALGFVIFAGMGFSALLFLRVSDPAPHGRPARERLPETGGRLAA